MTEEYDTGIQEKLDFFMDEGLMIHITFKDGHFLNGRLIKKLREGVYWLEERKLGQVFVFIRDIKELEEFKEVVG